MVKPDFIPYNTTWINLKDESGDAVTGTTINGQYGVLFKLSVLDEDGEVVREFYKPTSIDSGSLGYNGTVTSEIYDLNSAGFKYKQDESSEEYTFSNFTWQEGYSLSLEVSVVTTSGNEGINNFVLPKDQEKLTEATKIADFEVPTSQLADETIVYNLVEKPYKASVEVVKQAADSTALGDYYLAARLKKDNSNYWFVYDSPINSSTTSTGLFPVKPFATSWGATASVDNPENVEYYLYSGTNKPTPSELEQHQDSLIKEGQMAGHYDFSVTKGADHAEIKLTELKKNGYTVLINTYDLSGRPAPLDESARSEHFYLIAIIKDGSEIIGWQIKPVTFGDSATSTTIIFDANEFSKYVNGGDSTSERVDYYPDKYKMSVRLYDTEQTETIETYKKFVEKQHDGTLVDTVDGYVFDPAPSTNPEKTQTTISLKKDYDKKYNVEISFPDEESKQISSDEYYYVLVSAKHASTGTTYLLRRIENPGAANTITIENIGPGTPWDLSDGTVSTNVSFTGNEGVSIKILKATSELTLEQAKKEENCEIVSANYTRNSSSPDSESIVTVTDSIPFRKKLPTPTNDYTMRSILGSAANYGIVADTYKQTDHAQTNFAALNYSSNNNFQPDLGNQPGKVYIGNALTDIHLGDKQRHDFGSVEIHVGNMNGNKLIDDSHDANLIEGDKEGIDRKINGMLDYAKAKSDELAAKEPNYYPPLPDSNGNVTIDTTGFEDNTTIYIDADRIASAIAGTQNLKIKSPHLHCVGIEWLI